MSDSYEVKDFQKDVIEASKDTPVFVDFWAEWCGPCKMVSPVLEKLAQEANGKWKLVKVDTERNPQLASDWKIRGIPNMKLFSDGKVIGELTGALPEFQIQRWLEEHLPSESKKLLAAAKTRLTEGEENKAEALVRKALKLDPNLEDANLFLASMVVFKNPTEAQHLADRYKHLPEGEPIFQLAQALMKEKFNDAPVKDIVTNGIRKIKEQKLDDALNDLIESIMADKGYEDELARKVVVGVFFVLGEDHALTKKYRRKFSMALY